MKVKGFIVSFMCVGAAMLLMGAAVDTDGNPVKMDTDIGDIDAAETTVQDLKDLVAPGMNVNYATSSTASATAAKVASTHRYAVSTSDNDFLLTNGCVVVVKFTSSNTAETPTLNVNETGAKTISRYGSTSALGSAWMANEAVPFVYDGTNWQMLKPAYASTNYSGIVRLSTETNSVSTTSAATPSALRTVRQYVDTAVNTRVSADNVTNLVWTIYNTSSRYIYDSMTETCYRFSAENDFLKLTAVTNVPPTYEVIKELEKK